MMQIDAERERERERDRDRDRDRDRRGDWDGTGHSMAMDKLIDLGWACIVLECPSQNAEAPQKRHQACDFAVLTLGSLS